MKTPQQKQASKLMTTLNQWLEIRDNESKFSSDLRKHDVVSKAQGMINIIQSEINQLSV